jgi:hypothetical protein
MTTPTTSTRDRFEVFGEDPEYKYRWVNNRDMIMMNRVYEGWEPCHATDLKLPESLQKVFGQSTAAPAGGSLVQRGDLTLMRMRKEAFEERIAAPKRQARERQKASFDTMVEQANDNARRQARNAGLRNVPENMVFETTDNNKFGSQTGSVKTSDDVAAEAAKE